MVLVFALVAGCSGTDTSSSSAGTLEPGPTATGARPSDGGTGGGGDEGLAWVPFGPKDPTFPTPSWPAYNAFADGNCSKLGDYLNSSDAGELGQSGFAKAMLAVCRAAVDGLTNQWAVAEDNASSDAGALRHDCLASHVKGLLDRALAWHRDHPGQKPKVKFQRVEGQTDCGQKDSQPEVTDESSSTEESPTTENSPTTGNSPSPTDSSTAETTVEPTG